jgi:hypothetical protein
MGKSKKVKSRIVVELNGGLMIWENGVISGDEFLVAKAKELSNERFPVWIDCQSKSYTANLDDPNDRVGAVAAMIGLSVGRANILEIDDETFDVIGVRITETYEDILRIQGKLPLSSLFADDEDPETFPDHS